MFRVGVIGSFVWDVIYGREPKATPVEEWGGITYALSAFDAALPPDWSIVPIAKVGSDLYPRSREFLGTLKRLAPGAEPVEVQCRNNRVELRYETAERRSEVLQGGVPPWSWAGLQPLLRGLDALYINLISGFELDLPTALLIRQHFAGPIYGDLHSLMLTVQPDGLRTLRPLPNVAEWCSCFDLMQANEDEVAMMAPDPMALSATAIARGVRCLCVTLGRRGVIYVAAPGFERLGDLRRGHGVHADGGAVRTALVPAQPARVKTEGDPTGCGDVFGATYYSRLLAGDMLSDALRAALRAAARNVEFRGASGLAHYLRGELIPS